MADYARAEDNGLNGKRRSNGTIDAVHCSGCRGCWAGSAYAYGWLPNGVVNKRERPAEADVCDRGFMSGVAVANSITLVGSPWQTPLQIQLVWTPTSRDLVAPSQMKRDINESKARRQICPFQLCAIHSLMKAKRATQDPLDQYRNLVLRLVLRRIGN